MWQPESSSVNHSWRLLPCRLRFSTSQPHNSLIQLHSLDPDSSVTNSLSSPDSRFKRPTFVSCLCLSRPCAFSYWSLPIQHLYLTKFHFLKPSSNASPLNSVLSDFLPSTPHLCSTACLSPAVLIECRNSFGGRRVEGGRLQDMDYVFSLHPLGTGT